MFSRPICAGLALAGLLLAMGCSTNRCCPRPPPPPPPGPVGPAATTYPPGTVPPPPAPIQSNSAPVPPYYNGYPPRY